MTSEVLDALGDMLPKPLLLMEPRSVLDAAVVSIAFDEYLKPRAVYSMHMASVLLAQRDDMSYASANEWFSYNTSGEVVWLEDLVADADNMDVDLDGEE